MRKIVIVHSAGKLSTRIKVVHRTMQAKGEYQKLMQGGYHKLTNPHVTAPTQPAGCISNFGYTKVFYYILSDECRANRLINKKILTLASWALVSLHTLWLDVGYW